MVGRSMIYTPIWTQMVYHLLVRGQNPFMMYSLAPMVSCILLDPFCPCTFLLLLHCPSTEVGSCCSAFFLSGFCALKIRNQESCGKHTIKDGAVEETAAKDRNPPFHSVSYSLREQRKKHVQLLEDMHPKILRTCKGCFPMLRTLSLSDKVPQSPISCISLHRILNIKMG